MEKASRPLHTLSPLQIRLAPLEVLFFGLRHCRSPFWPCTCALCEFSGCSEASWNLGKLLHPRCSGVPQTLSPRAGVRANGDPKALNAGGTAGSEGQWDLGESSGNGDEAGSCNQDPTPASLVLGPGSSWLRLWGPLPALSPLVSQTQSSPRTLCSSFSSEQVVPGPRAPSSPRNDNGVGTGRCGCSPLLGGDSWSPLPRPRVRPRASRHPP